MLQRKDGGIAMPPDQRAYLRTVLQRGAHRVMVLRSYPTNLGG
jgi:hypothetical protein